MGAFFTLIGRMGGGEENTWRFYHFLYRPAADAPISRSYRELITLEVVFGASICASNIIGVTTTPTLDRS